MLMTVRGTLIIAVAIIIMIMKAGKHYFYKYITIMSRDSETDQLGISYLPRSRSSFSMLQHEEVILFVKEKLPMILSCSLPYRVHYFQYLQCEDILSQI